MGGIAAGKISTFWRKWKCGSGPKIDRFQNPDLKIFRDAAESVEERILEVLDDDVLRLADNGAHELAPRDIGTVGMQQGMRIRINESQLLKPHHGLHVALVPIKEEG